MKGSTASDIGVHAAALAGLLRNVGDDRFGKDLLHYFNDQCGAEYCTVYHLGMDAPDKIVTADLQDSEIGHQQVAFYLQDNRWRRDPMFAEARRQLDGQPFSIVHTAICELPRADFRDILYERTNVCDRALLCSRSENGMIALCLLRTAQQGAFRDEDLTNIHDLFPVLMATVEKHIELTEPRPDLGSALRSLNQIQNCLSSAATPLSQREAEVCARILYGVSSLGISLELGISEETVMTYRKRAYQRLGLASQRELLLWYLDLWNALYLRNRGRLH